MPAARLARLLHAVLACATAAPVLAQHEDFKLVAPDGHELYFFGWSVAVDAQVAAIGSSEDSVWLFDATTGIPRFELTASDTTPGDGFGRSVALHGDRLLVGAPFHDGLAWRAGAAYLFDVTSGRQLLRLTASDGDLQHEFGASLALDGDMLVVGAPHDTFDPAALGRVYLFDAASGAERLELFASDGVPFDQFGIDVALRGDRLVVGTQGDADFGAYVFDVTTGQELYKLTHPGVVDFGLSVALGDGRVVVGSPGENRAYVFDLATGAELFELAPYGSGSGSGIFGTSLAAHGGTVVVGAYHDGAGADYAGAAYGFDLEDGLPLFQLYASDAQPFDGYGRDVAIHGERALIGAPWEDGLGYQAGAAYIHAARGPGTPFCSGDGSGAACPCSNPGSAGQGCRNSTGRGSALVGHGSAGAGDDQLRLAASMLIPGELALAFVGLAPVNGGSGRPFGDGLRCVGSRLVRLGARTPDAHGDALWGPGLGLLGGWSAGDARYFQVFYRDANGPCGSGFNLTNALAVTFLE